MAIADADVLEPGIFGRLPALPGICLGEQGQIRKMELGMKGQEGVGHMGIVGCHEFGQVADLLRIHISGDHQGAGDQCRRNGALLCLLGGPFKVGQSPPVGDAGERLVQMVIKGFEIEFDASAGFNGQVHDLVQEFGMHGSIGLPADSQDTVAGSLSGAFCRPNGEWDLGRGITAKIADARRAVIHRCRQIVNGSHFRG